MTHAGRKGNVALWTMQVLLALLFLFAGSVKLLMPADQLAAQSGMPTPFLKFIAVCELLGAAGLVLPGALRIARGLTPLAAAGLVVLMAGATVTTIRSVGWLAAAMPLVTGALAAWVAYGRRSWWASRPRPTPTARLAE